MRVHGYIISGNVSGRMVEKTRTLKILGERIRHEAIFRVDNS
jgi:hypothetical protein